LIGAKFWVVVDFLRERIPQLSKIKNNVCFCCDGNDFRENKKRRLGRADESENMHSMKEGVQLFIEPVLSTRARSMLTF
jgi:hypothetical protein